ncbi:defender against death DAD protein [Amniculicola lignicola CBS 123094]|uniref:Dolichyl-diphosphooligosaccharide--protein glycosyltransferase subunit OST2 n=1 Tax=Amniculicola lignicola CBS 123094 TaxID=1392246 RepID=A0A6A5WUB4_9PLEO|nr:defender against death DAD protein [Amniculicola lignicola CBS 123094]
MAPKNRNPAATQSSTQTVPSTPAAAPKPSSSSTKKPGSGGAYDAQDIVLGIWNKYVEKTPQRVKLLDTFMGFLVVVAVLQFLYCIIVGNFPFNAFLSGFSATVGQFVLTASLRIQTNPENKSEFENISHERAFADFVLGSFLLHFFCVNFIN